MIATVILSQELRARIEAHARAALPGECCGLLEGVRQGDAARVTAVHAARNLAEARDRFEIDPAEHIRLLRALRGTEREIVGCYHSHPNGRAGPSPRDRKAAAEDDFVWLIAAVPGEMGVFVFRDGGFVSVPLAA